MSERTVVAESVRVSRAQQDAAALAHDAQDRARMARIERLEQRVQQTINVLFSVCALCWLIGLAVIVFWGMER